MSDRKQSFRAAPLLEPPSEERITEILDALLLWGPVRDFPWRRQTATPFQKLIAEILLTRTTAEAVARVIEQLWRRFPTPSDMANAQVEEIAGIVARLGLRKRARMLQECAQAIQEGGFPRDRAALVELPGVGRYVSDAVRVFAFDEPVIPIDAVIGRVLRRVLGYTGFGPAYADRALWQVGQRFARPTGTGRIVAALLDLGAIVCLPQRPRCEVCPLTELCVYHLHGECGHNEPKKQEN